MSASSRREFLWHALCGCALSGIPGALRARVLPTDLPPLLAPAYRPVDADEKGLWQACDDLEKGIASSKLLLKDPQINAYLLGVMARLLGERAAELRLYVVRNAAFNASMAPNGMLIVHTGLLA